MIVLRRRTDDDYFYYYCIGICLIIIFGRSSSSNSSGTVGCPCINTTELFSPLENCRTINGEAGIWLDSIPPSCYPLDYGASVCAKHDLMGNERCFVSSDDEDNNNNNNNGVIPSFCFDSWCYVDYEQCQHTTEAIHRTNIMGSTSLENNLFYSYTVCGSTAEEFMTYQTVAPLEGKELIVTVPEISDPLHYKYVVNPNHTSDRIVADESGPEYYDDTIPWEGIIIDYFNTLVGISNLKGVRYTHRTKTGDFVFNTSAYSAAVVDVQSGLSDMGLSYFWITSQRLGRAMYTRPFATQQYLLWIPEPSSSNGGTNTVAFNALKVFRPFEPKLWAILIALVAFVGMVHVLLVATYHHRGEEDSDLYKDLHSLAWKQAPFKQKSFILSKIFFDSVITFYNAMFGFSNDMGTAHRIAPKILMFGFYFLTLITVAAFTANLAAFLTLSTMGDYISTMEEVIQTKTPLCAFRFLGGDLEISWPDVNFVYYSSHEGMFQNYETGECTAFALSMVDVLMTQSLMDWVCNNKIVSTGTLILQKYIAFPINDKYAGGMSYWISLAEKQGLSYAAFEDMRKAQALCTFDLSTDQQSVDDLQPLTPADFFLPVMICVGSAVLAVLLHFNFFIFSSKHQDDSKYIEKLPSKDIIVGGDDDNDNNQNQNQSQNHNDNHNELHIYDHGHDQIDNIVELMALHTQVFQNIQDILTTAEVTEDKKNT